VEALARLLAEAPLSDQTTQEDGRLGPLAPAHGRALERLDDLVETARVSGRERAGNDPRAHHHPQVDVLDRGDAFLDEKTCLDQRLELKTLYNRLEDVGVSCRAHRSPF